MACNVLMLCSDASRVTGTTNDHLEAFRKYSHHNLVQVDSKTVLGAKIDLNLFDCLVFHHSIVISGFGYLSGELEAKIKKFNGPKILFIQDEMRWVDATNNKIKELNIKTIFTVVNIDVVRDIYRGDYFDDVRFEFVLTGYVPESLVEADVPSYPSRPLDVSYRARRLPAWYGESGQEKWIIGKKFKTDVLAAGLKVDISWEEADRIYGDDWIKFVSNSKAVLGTESGASFIDYSGKVAPAVEAYEARHPKVSFEAVRDRFLEGRDGKSVIHVISPRCFEAAALRTLMIMYEGSYSGVLQANRHYVPLARDHSNMADVVDILRSPEKAEKIINSAYDEIACSGKWLYRSMISKFDIAVDEIVSSSQRLPIGQLSVEQINAIETKSQKISRKYRRNLNLALLLADSGNRIYGKVCQFLPERVGLHLHSLRKPLFRSVGRIIKIFMPY